MMKDSYDDDYVNDQDQMLMMIIHYTDTREAMKNIHHQLSMDVEKSFKKKTKQKKRGEGYLSPHALS
jgi:hypothetical protein